MSKETERKLSNLKDYLRSLAVPVITVALYLVFKAFFQLVFPSTPHRPLIGTTGLVVCVVSILVLPVLLYRSLKQSEAAGLRRLALERLLRFAGQCLLNNHEPLSQDDRSAAQDNINIGLYRLYSRPYSRNTSSMMYDSRPADLPLARQLADAAFAIL